MSRRRVIINNRDKGETEVKRLNFHYCPIKDILTVEGRLFKGDDFRNGDVITMCGEDRPKPKPPTEEVKPNKRGRRNANSTKVNK